MTKLTPIIETKKLTHIYSVGTPFERVAIKDIDFKAYPGEYLSIIGRTGSGKSTLIQHFNGLVKPTKGSVLYNGEDIHTSKEKTRAVRFNVGLVFQYPEYQLFEETVYKDIAFGPKNMGLDEREIDRRVRRMAELVGLTASELNESPFDLSGGQKRRAAIAGVMAMMPKVLVLDEPTAGLDPEGCKEIIENINNYRREENAAIITVTHDMSDAAGEADRLYVMYDGEVYMNGTPEEVFSDEDRLENIGLALPEITRIARRLRNIGLAVPAAVYRRDQLKDALLKLKGGRTDA